MSSSESPFGPNPSEPELEQEPEQQIEETTEAEYHCVLGHDSGVVKACSQSEAREKFFAKMGITGSDHTFKATRK